MQPRLFALVTPRALAAWALLAAALPPIAASASLGTAIATPVLADASERGDVDPLDFVVECTKSFPSSSYGLCTAQWWQTGSFSYSWHQRFHSLAVYGGYSVLSWRDARGEIVFVEQCSHLVSSLEFSWTTCPTYSSWSPYWEGWQTLYAYGSAGPCVLDCIVHGKLTITPT